MKKNNKKILIVEDEAPMAKALVLKFEHNGFVVKSAPNGEDALVILKDETFDVIIMDLMMPEVDGFKVLEQINKLKIETPVFILSNLSQDEDKQKVIELGAEAFFIKSNVSIKEMVEQVEDFLAK